MTNIVSLLVTGFVFLYLFFEWNNLIFDTFWYLGFILHDRSKYEVVSYLDIMEYTKKSTKCYRLWNKYDNLARKLGENKKIDESEKMRKISWVLSEMNQNYTAMLDMAVQSNNDFANGKVKLTKARDEIEEYTLDFNHKIFYDFKKRIQDIDSNIYHRVFYSELGYSYV